MQNYYYSIVITIFFIVYIRNVSRIHRNQAKTKKNTFLEPIEAKPKENFKLSLLNFFLVRPKFL